MKLRLFFLFFAFLHYSCTNVDMPKDFDIEYNCHLYRINTFDSLYFRHYANKDTLLRLELTQKEKNLIYQFILEVNMFDYAKKVSNCVEDEFFICSYDSIKIRADGKIYCFYWGDRNYYKAQKLDELVYQLHQIVKKKDNIRKLPDRTIY